METGYQAQVGEDGKARFHGDLPQDQLELLKKNSPTADEILEHVDELAEEARDAAMQSGAVVLEEEVEPDTVVKLPEVALPTPSKKRGSVGQKFNPSERAKPQGEEMDLDKELEDIKQEADVASPVAEDMRSQILELLKNTPGAPSPQAIAKMKAEKGENAVHVIAFGEGDVYIYTHLDRGTWKKVNETMIQLQQQGNEPNLEDKLKEKVIQYSVLWPALPLEFFYKSRAGVVDSLYQVIMLQSYFLTPQQSISLSIQL